MRGRPVCVISIIVAFGALGFWVLAAMSAFAGVDPHGSAMEVGGGTALTIISVNFWRDWRQVRRDQERERADEDKALLIKTLADAVPARRAVRPLRPTRPLPLPRAL